MEQPLLSRILAKIGIAILTVALADLLFVNYWLIKNEDLKGQKSTAENGIQLSRVIEPKPESSPTPSFSPSSSPTKSSSAQPSPIFKTETVIEKQTQTIIQTSQKEIFVPMGSGSTNSHTFFDLSGTDVTIDTSKYPTIDSVVFEASIWPEGGNGRAYAQITNVTDNNPLIESQITSTSSSGTVKTSGKIPIPTGQKTYRIQAKTDITNFVAHVDNARIKITLR